jgi:hypothetical protein
LDEAISFPIYKGMPEDLIQHIAGRFFGQVPQTYFSFYNNYLVFSNNSKSLQSFLYANVLSKTLANQKHFERFRENFSLKENVFVYGELNSLPTHLSGIIYDKLIGFNEDQLQALDNFYAGGLQIATTGNLLYASVCINYLPSRGDEPQTVWQSHMDSTIAMKPVLVKNHNTSEREILIQDAAHNLYLINTSGRVQWKKALDGAVMGEVVQIDFYRNNKLQYLFNTKERIYLIDRNGNSVDRYPVRLPSRASNSLSVFDYDNNRNYRIFIATEDKKIRLLDKRANSITGWTFSNTEGTVLQPVQHFRTNSKDYIVFADEYRAYILDRKGNQRVKPDKRFLVNGMSQFYLKGIDSPTSELITSSTSGEIVAIRLPSGVTRLVPVGDPVAENHAFACFEINQTPRYVFLTGKDLLVLDPKGRKVFHREFDETLNPSIDLYQFSSNNMKLGVVEKNGGQIFLLNADGTNYKGFPLKGNSRYSIGFLKNSSRQFNLLVGGDNNYLYNYIVE